MTVTVEFQRLPGAEDIPLPRYQTAGAAGMDLHAAVTEPLVIGPGTWQLVPCGCRVAIERGARIAQILICPVARATVHEVERLPETARAEGGFGHTGT